jgi:hypothetical protein
VGRHTVTGVLRASGGVGLKHHTTFHRFFRKAIWDPDVLGIFLIRLVLRFIPRQEPIYIPVDDTLGRHTGKCISAAGMHHDPLLSTRTKAVFHFGHVWVVLAMVIRVPRWNKAFALPVMARLYRPEKVCVKEGTPFYKKTDLAVQMIHLLALVCCERQCYVIGDALYANSSVVKSLPPNVHFVGRGRPDAALYAVPKQKRMGRPRVKGERLPSPSERASLARGWRRFVVSIHGKEVSLLVKVFNAIWYKVSGGRCLRFTLVRGWPGHEHDDVLCSTDLTLSAEEMIHIYCLRWNVEVTFQETKGRLGFEDVQNRTKKAVERTAPMALWTYTLTVTWYIQTHLKTNALSLPQFPWYEKTVPSFSDMLASLRREIWRHRVLDLLPLNRRDQKSVDPILDALGYAA